MITPDIQIDDTAWRIRAEGSAFAVHASLMDTINDIADTVQRVAQANAPMGAGENVGDVPGTLKKSGIIKREASVFDLGGGDFGLPGSFVTNIPAFGGGFSVRGGNPSNRGQFTRQVSKLDTPGTRFTGGFTPSRTVISAVVELNPAVRHAKFVHGGTGIYGPHHKPIVPRFAPYLVFRWHGRRWSKKSVRGQPAQPFLTEAYVYVNDIYMAGKLSELRAELAAEL